MLDASGDYGFAFAEPLILLFASVVGVALSRRLGLGSVLGYLAAGVVIGPVARLITGAQEIMQVAELGIVMFLFIIGLELKPARLWAMRTDIFGFGLAQVARDRRDPRRRSSTLPAGASARPSSSVSGLRCRRPPSACRC